MKFRNVCPADDAPAAASAEQKRVYEREFVSRTFFQRPHIPRPASESVNRASRLQTRARSEIRVKEYLNKQVFFG